MPHSSSPFALCSFALIRLYWRRCPTVMGAVSLIYWELVSHFVPPASTLSLSPLILRGLSTRRRRRAQGVTPSYISALLLKQRTLDHRHQAHQDEVGSKCLETHIGRFLEP